MDPLTRSGGLVAPEYLSLYTYLENRYADMVVLTFAHIEDLLGFALPDRARQHDDWWANTDPQTPPPAHAQAWIVAHRTARPNLRAQTVAFERRA